MSSVYLYTDGACKGNLGVGGWGALLRYGSHEKELYGGEAHTTNNRMELTAIIAGLSALTRPCEVVICTDSQYVKNGMESWIHSWKRNGWQTASKKPVKRHQVTWTWVKGHSGHPENERADALANLGVEDILNN